MAKVESTGDREDKKDGYDADVSLLIEQGTSAFPGGFSSISPVQKNADAFLLYNRPKVTLENLIAMRRTDGMARALCNLITLPIKLGLVGGSWVAPPEGDADEEVEFANLMWSLSPELGGMTTTVSKLVDQILLSVLDGYAAFEICGQVPTVGPLKNKLTLKKLAYRDPRTITLLQDANGGYAGFRQVFRRPDGEMVDKSLSPRKTVLFTSNSHENPLYGVSMLESGYPHYEHKMKFYYIAGLAAQFQALPGRVGTIPKSAKPSDARAFRDAISKIALNTSMIMKEGYKLEPFAGTNVFPFMSYIEHHNLMMAKSVLASFMETEQRTVLVENTTQDASADIFLLAMQTIANEIAEILTHYVMPKFIKLNFKNSTKFPVFKPGPLSQDANRKISSIFEKVMMAPILNVTPEFARELEKKVSSELGLGIDYNEIETREEEASIQASEQAEIQARLAQQETLEEERAADGALPGSKNVNSMQPKASIDQASLSNPDEEDLSLGNSEVDRFVNAIQNMFTDTVDPKEVDDGYSEWYNELVQE